MADISLTNTANVEGQYGDGSSPISLSSNTVTTTIVQGLTVTKSADKTNWIDGPLTYTILVENNSGPTLSSGVLTDNLNISLVEFSNSYGVKIDGSTSSEFTYNSDTGELKIALPDLADSNQTTITFQVTRKS